MKYNISKISIERYGYNNPQISDDQPASSSEPTQAILPNFGPSLCIEFDSIAYRNSFMEIFKTVITEEGPILDVLNSAFKPTITVLLKNAINNDLSDLDIVRPCAQLLDSTFPDVDFEKAISGALVDDVLSNIPALAPGFDASKRGREEEEGTPRNGEGAKKQETPEDKPNKCVLQ